MKERVARWQVAGVVFASVLGTFLHFLFDLTGGSPAAALVSAVNESIWEHMKLLFYPLLLFSIPEYFVWGRDQSYFWWIKLAGTLLGLGLIPVLYYTYTGILGRSADWFNIAIFFIAAGIVFRAETAAFQNGIRCPLPGWPAILLLCLISLLFTVLTFSPPRIPLFRDPVTGTYGFRKLL